MLFSDEVEKFIPPRKGRSHVLRVIREVLFFEPKRRGTDLVNALEFMGASRAQGHRGGDFGFHLRRRRGKLRAAETLQTALRMANRKHDVVAVQITDRHELELPALGRLILEDAETGEILEGQHRQRGSRDAFALRQEKQRANWRDNSVRRALIRFNCARTNLRRRSADFLRRARNGGCEDEKRGYDARMPGVRANGQK
jgi:uncharacterized protein (DUF58 family)